MRSSPRRWLRLCPGPVVGAPRCACGRRSPGSDPGCLGRGPRRWASADPTQPATPSTAAAGAAGGRADVPIAGRVGETPVASLAARGSVCPKPGPVFRGGRGSVPESRVGSTRYGRNWSFAARTISAPITPIKSAPCAPNWSFARSQGSWFRGAGSRSGSGAG